MKVLLSSIGCHPYGISEGIYGWRACEAIAKDHEVWVLTEPNNREHIERARAEGRVPGSMHIVYAGDPWVPHQNRMVARAQSWLSYMRFQKQCLPVARQLHAEIGFDVVQLVTYTTWRVGCPLWQLGIPLIWGPISGTEMFPLRFLGILSPSSMAFEFARIAQSLVGQLSTSVRECAEHAACIPTTHTQAYEWLSRLRGKTEGVSVFCNVFFADRYIAELKREWPSEPHRGPLRLFGSGNMEGRKGIALALHALARAKARGLKFTYRFSSRGPELAHLEKLRDRLGLQAEVTLGEALSRPDFFAALKSSDIYLLPSLREGAGQTMMEAMLAGCVPVVAKLGGPAEIVTDECGFRVTARDPNQVIADLTELLLRLDGERELLLAKGKLAEQRIAENYNERNYRAKTNALYQAALAERQGVCSPVTT